MTVSVSESKGATNDCVAGHRTLTRGHNIFYWSGSTSSHGRVRGLIPLSDLGITYVMTRCRAEDCPWHNTTSVVVVLEGLEFGGNPPDPDLREDQLSSYDGWCYKCPWGAFYRSKALYKRPLIPLVGRESKGKKVYSREKPKIPLRKKIKIGHPSLFWSMSLVHEGGFLGSYGLPTNGLSGPLLALWAFSSPFLHVLVFFFYYGIFVVFTRLLHCMEIHRWWRELPVLRQFFAVVTIQNKQIRYHRFVTTEPPSDYHSP